MLATTVVTKVRKVPNTTWLEICIVLLLVAAIAIALLELRTKAVGDFNVVSALYDWVWNTILHGQHHIAKTFVGLFQTIAFTVVAVFVTAFIFTVSAITIINILVGLVAHACTKKI